MLYAILCYHNEDVVMSWSKEEDDAVLAKRRRVQKELVDKGRMGPAIRLMPTSAATTIRASGSEQLVLDGPFAETKEQLLGFYVVDCDNLDEVVDFAKRMKEGESVTFEIRPMQIFEKGNLTGKETLTL
ncbi:YciI family protein [Nitratireductor aquimarinus]|uniref:YciI family protein n=1 Tax=Alphaproteobacteria TaxID=28211 RepID=UPI000DDDCB28|nr:MULTISPECIES: YciI family protein [Alphaproteobacteria]MBY6022286.1 YciI family protein [Nitratireductor sp. DP7N14-4]MBN7757497.1 YciI family protein [Nitratireductor aquimarinus]MBN8242764.1 YciI family protein [Nitratireductor aquimarinus]MBY6000257.1 YciI family protein [Tritonibacter mobilis]MBY6131864.1 YciI family protein [Nitratireductor aquimarinus]